LAGPELRVRVTGAHGLAGTPPAGFIPRAVSGVCWLVLVSMVATLKPAPEMALTASSRFWPDTLGMAVCLSEAVPFCSDAAFGASGGSAADTRAQTRDYRVNMRAGWRNAASRVDAGGGAHYVVRPGDTRWGISAELGTTVRGLAVANGIANPDVISVGQRIYY
jgi:hypothetical protein